MEPVFVRISYNFIDNLIQSRRLYFNATIGIKLPALWDYQALISLQYNIALDLWYLIFQLIYIFYVHEFIFWNGKFQLFLDILEYVSVVFVCPSYFKFIIYHKIYKNQNLFWPPITRLHYNLYSLLVSLFNHIYQPLRSGRIWHKVNF